MKGDFEIRELSEPWEFQEAVEVQASAWNMRDYREAAPAHLLRALADNGGLVLGAFIGGKMAGVSYGWPVDGEYFYSHATGVRRDVKYRGVGYALKLEQRRRVIERYDLTLAKWTFDPLQSLNSRFNLFKLGVIARVYLINYYGEIRDEINRGLGSDRVKGEWHLDSGRVRARIEGSVVGDNLALERLQRMGAQTVLEVRGAPPRPGEPVLDPTSDVTLLPIPKAVSELREVNPELPRLWREATRRVYSRLIGELGYVLVDSVKGEKENIYYNVLWRAPLKTILEGVEPWRIPI